MEMLLIAKQGQRFLQNTHSLFYRVFKAKHIPKGTLLHAKLSPIFNTYDMTKLYGGLSKVEKMCTIQREGNGGSIDVWHDRWSPIELHHVGLRWKGWNMFMILQTMIDVGGSKLYCYCFVRASASAVAKKYIFSHTKKLLYLF